MLHDQYRSDHCMFKSLGKFCSCRAISGLAKNGRKVSGKIHFHEFCWRKEEGNPLWSKCVVIYIADKAFKWSIFLYIDSITLKWDKSDDQTDLSRSHIRPKEICKASIEWDIILAGLPTQNWASVRCLRYGCEWVSLKFQSISVESLQDLYMSRPPTQKGDLKKC